VAISRVCVVIVGKSRIRCVIRGKIAAYGLQLGAEVIPNPHPPTRPYCCLVILQIADSPNWSAAVRDAYPLDSIELSDSDANLCLLRVARQRFASTAPYLTDGGLSGGEFGQGLRDLLDDALTTQGLDSVLIKTR